jgi:AcrR family transcriptional regulator
MTPRRAAALREVGDQNLRQHLITTAERLIARRGTVGLTVREIAREARVADGVLYNHFADKEELLALAVHAHIRAVDAALGAPPGPAGSGTVEANLTAYIDRSLVLHAAILPAFAGLLGQPGVLARLAALPTPVAGGRELRDDLADYLRAEQRLGRLAAAADVETAATMLIGACHELILPHLFSGSAHVEVEVPPGFATDLVATVLHGIGPAGPAGRPAVGRPPQAR